jgi:flagellar basal body-associated protein FliL
MSYSENRQQTFPAVPPSHSAGDHEMRDYYADAAAPQPTPNQAPYLTPYLGLQARLSQIWINRWTVLLLLVLVRVLLMIASTDSGLSSARREALSACTSVEAVGSTMASIPHYMSQGVNSLTAKGITKAVNGLESMVGLTVTGVEELVVFVIGMLTNTYLCLTTFAVTGSLSAVIGAIESAQKDLNTMTAQIGGEISDVSSDVQSSINSLVNGINTFLGTDAPKVDFTKQINELKNLTLPDSLFQDLQKLNNSLPTFEDVKNATESVIRLPFEELKKVISREVGNYTFNSSVFPVPQKEQLSFCSDSNGLNDFFDDLVVIAHTAKKIFIGVLTVAAILVCVPMAWWEIKRYRRLSQRAVHIHNTHTDPMDAVYMSSRPFTSRIGQWAAGKFSSPRKQILARWFVAYCTSLPALFILSLALAGLFACLCQYIMLSAIKKEVPNLTDQVANFTGAVVKKLDNASMLWATGTNAAIMAENIKLNDDLFGWVNTSTTAVNNTLNEFIDQTMDVLNKTFGGTPLYTPIKEVFNCLIGLKVQGIQEGLTWVHDNAHINFPLLDNDTLSLQSLAAKSDSDAANNLLADPTGASQDAISGAVTKVTDAIARGIRQEAIISTMLLVVWLLLVLAGFITTFVRMGGRNKVRGESGNEWDIDSYSAPTNPEIKAMARPESAAPPYVPNPDINSNGYTLRHHEPPRRSEESDTINEKRSPGGWPISRNLTGRDQSPSRFPNEKNGFI